MKKLAYLYLIVTFYQQAHQATPPIPPDYTSHQNYQLYDSYFPRTIQEWNLLPLIKVNSL